VRSIFPSSIDPSPRRRLPWPQVRRPRRATSSSLDIQIDAPGSRGPAGARRKASLAPPSCGSTPWRAGKGAARVELRCRRLGRGTRSELGAWGSQDLLTCTCTGAGTVAATPTPRPRRTPYTPTCCSRPPGMTTWPPLTRQRQCPRPPRSSSGAAPAPTPARDAATPLGAPRAAGPRRLCVLSWCCGGCRAREFGAGLSEVPAARAWCGGGWVDDWVSGVEKLVGPTHRGWKLKDAAAAKRNLEENVLGTSKYWSSCLGNGFFEDTVADSPSPTEPAGPTSPLYM
jgi:hypothetical protein